MPKIFSKLMKTINPLTQVTQWTSSAGNMKKTTPKCITIIKLLKISDEGKNLKESEKKDTLLTEKQQ